MAQNNVIKKVGKEIAPYLKQIAAAWFLGLHDPYATTSTAAKHSFESAFPTEKQQKALTFCQQVILDVGLAYLSDFSRSYFAFLSSVQT